MILRQPALVTCEDHLAFTKPIGQNMPGLSEWQVFDRNFTYPGGLPGFVNGLVTQVPAGTDINPKIKEQATIGRAMGCMVVAQYTPPTYVGLSIYMRTIYGATGYQGMQLMRGRVDTDCVLLDGGGNQVRWLNGEFVSDQGNFRNIGTLLSVQNIGQSGVPYGGTGLVRNLRIKTERGCIVRIETFEPGDTGIVTAELIGSGVAATLATRVSDDTQQVLTYGQMYLGPGSHDIGVKINNSFDYSPGVNTAVEDCRILILPEIPYGI